MRYTRNDMALFSPDIPVGVPLGTPKVAVLASGSGTNFAAIADAVSTGELDVEIVGVIYNNPAAGVAERAQLRQIPALLLDHRTFATREAHDNAIVGQLSAWEVEWVVMAGWMRIVTDVLLDAFAGRILNIHPSLLPAFRGLDAVGQALAAGVTITGCTVHVVTDTLDDGPIIAQAAVEVAPDDSRETLHARIHEAEHALYPRAIAHAISSAGAGVARRGS